MKNLQKTILALIAVSLTIGFIWYGSRTVTPKKAEWDDVRAEAIQGGYQLISTDKLWQQYQSNPASLLVVDTRQEWEYRSGHIPTFPWNRPGCPAGAKKGNLELFWGPTKID